MNARPAPPLSAGRTPGPAPWAGERDPARGMVKRPAGPRPVLPLPPGSSVVVIPDQITRRNRAGAPFRAEGTDALARVRALLVNETGDPTAALRNRREFMSWARYHGWYVVVIDPDGTPDEPEWAADRRRAATSPFWHDLAALVHVADVDEVAAARLERAERERAERLAAQVATREARLAREHAARAAAVDAAPAREDTPAA